MLRRTQINLLTLKNSKIYTDDVLIEAAATILVELQRRYDNKFVIRRYFLDAERLVKSLDLKLLLEKDQPL